MKIRKSAANHRIVKEFATMKELTNYCFVYRRSIVHHTKQALVTGRDSTAGMVANQVGDKAKTTSYKIFVINERGFLVSFDITNKKWTTLFVKFGNPPKKISGH
jgi:hypothetical protein